VITMQDPVIPPEITETCRNGGSILVGGGPGSGKTIFTLSLLLRLKRLGMETTFVSTRLPIRTLLKISPLCNKLGLECLVDSSLQRGLGDEPRVTRIPLTDLSDLAMLLLQKCNDNSVVALDSWDALLQREKRPSHEVYTAAADLINRTPGSLVFTTEEIPSPNPLEHVADAQLTLDVETEGASWVRFLNVDKLRGRSIDRIAHIFTLTDGVFRVYDPPDWRIRERLVSTKKIPEPIPDNDSHFSTGLRRLDRILGGGYRRGSYVGIEIDLEAPPELFDLTFLPMASDFLVKGRPVIALPPGARDADSLWETARMILDEEAWNYMKTEMIDKYAKILSFGTRTRDDSTVVIGSDIENDFAIWKKTKKELKYRFDKPILGIMGYDTLVRMYGAESVEPIIGRTLSETRQLGDIMISVVTSDLSVKSYVLGISDYYFRIKLLRGVPIFLGVKPRTPPYALTIFNDNEVPKTNLIRIS